MMSKKMIGSLSAPILGTLPIVIFFTLDFFFSYHVALMGSLFTFALYFLLGVMILKIHPPYTVLLTTFIYLLFGAFSIIPPFKFLYIHQSSVVFELLLVLVFYVFVRTRDYFHAKIILKNEADKDFHLIRFEADLYVVKLALHLILAHLLIVLVYSMLPLKYHSVGHDEFIYFGLLLLLIIGHFIYEFSRLYSLRRRLLSEDWLPTVDGSGAVRGRVARSTSVLSGNKYCHPVIRIALIHKGMLFLRKRSPLMIGGTEAQLDYPLERHLRFKESLDQGLEKTLAENGFPVDLRCRYILRHEFKNEKTNQLIYLYACNILDEKTLGELSLSDGKWWTGKQIDENMGTGLFSPIFESEYELLDNTVLAADRLMRDL